MANRPKISTLDEVEIFLLNLKELLSRASFNSNLDLDIILKKKTESPLDRFITSNTLIELNYDKKDVVRELLSLTVEEYLETVIDDKEGTWPDFYTFGKILSILQDIRWRIGHTRFQPFKKGG